MSIQDAEDGVFIRAYTANGVEYEVRRVGGTFFAVFPNSDVPVISEGQKRRDEAARAGLEISELLS